MALEAVLRRDRAVVVAALFVVLAISWAYILWLAVEMAAMPAMPVDAPMAEMPGMDMGAAMEPGFRPWSAVDFAFTFAMWAVMMVGMMTPSVAPMLLLYANVGRKAREGRAPFASTGWFLAGYLLIWVAFSLAATAAQWLLAYLALLSPTMATTHRVLGAALLVAAGLYQFTPLKQVCLRQCRTPMAFLATHGGFRSDPFGALRLGARHGVYCLGCCWALMALLFVGGIMNVLWLAGIAILILLEKTAPLGQWIPRLSGLLLIVAGAWLLVAGSG
jgi:predicted metal-binding membrane protein